METPAQQQIDRLILVYNADSGLVNAVLDSARKLLSIRGCALCELTHTVAGERTEWRSCRDTLGIPVDYIHRDEIDDRLRRVIGSDLPCVLGEVSGALCVLMRSDVIARCQGSIDDFRARLEAHARMLGLSLPG